MPASVKLWASGTGRFYRAPRCTLATAVAREGFARRNEAEGTVVLREDYNGPIGELKLTFTLGAPGYRWRLLYRVLELHDRYGNAIYEDHVVAQAKRWRVSFSMVEGARADELEAVGRA